MGAKYKLVRGLIMIIVLMHGSGDPQLALVIMTSTC